MKEMQRQNKWTPPESTVLKTKDWLLQNLKDEKKLKAYYQEIFPEQRINLKKPISLDQPLWNTVCEHPSAFVSVIPNGRVWGEYTIISPDNKLLWDVSYSLNDKPEASPIFQEKELPPIKYLNETVAVIAWAGQGNFYHWFYDILPRIYLLRKSGIKIDRYIVNAYPHHPKTLELLGIPIEKQIHIHHPSKNFHLQAKNLIVPSAKFNNAKWTVDFIRSEFLSKYKVRILPGYERIYISREDASYRKIQNEDIVYDILKKYGFRKVHLGSLPLDMQFSIFHSAKVIISPMSAALSSIAFSQPGTKIIEMVYATGHAFNGFWQTCNYLDMEYYYFTCPIVPPQKEHYNHNDLTVDINKLYKSLELAGINKISN
ncbi:capsular polysaccharide biosynthesis protein [Bacillus tianshenii]|uniref:Capsular polysaccharide biosynthesis protein n=1 Tax=Sutcliffiella tianshenii TaxID=1463404 RepID=A0ABS2P538_9BACI|nr:capsular polysaccharide biosynthesis protein [Bacillus tianshenii]